MKSKKVILDKNLWISFLISRDFSFLDKYIETGKIFKMMHDTTTGGYNQLLDIKLRKLSYWVAPVYLDTESLWQRK